VRPIWASDMLKTAGRLAGRQAGPGRPALCDLRRATSTAYYALFHQITRHGAFASVGTATEDEVSFLARWYSHTGIRAAAELVVVADSSNAPKKGDRTSVELLRGRSGSVPDKLLLVAETFVELQDRRHEADYSNDYDPVRYATLDHVDSADAAVRAAWSMWTGGESTRASRQTTHDSYRRFLQLALLKSGGPKTR
jgi:hypothetical protein